MIPCPDSSLPITNKQLMVTTTKGQGLVVNGQAALATFGSSGFAFCALGADFVAALAAFGFCSTLPGMTLSASSLIRVRTSHRWYRSLRLEILMPSFPPRPTS